MYELKTVTYADADNPAAVKIYKELLVEAMLQKLKENGKLR